MDLAMAKQLLSTAVKGESRDHAFGDCEVYWYDGENNIATGYFGAGVAEVTVQVEMENGGLNFTNFEGDAAYELRKCFASEQIDRNDSTGPDTFEVGKVMPGLTKEGVRKELTGE